MHVRDKEVVESAEANREHGGKTNKSQGSETKSFLDKSEESKKKRILSAEGLCRSTAILLNSLRQQSFKTVASAHTTLPTRPFPVNTIVREKKR